MSDRPARIKKMYHTQETNAELREAVECMKGDKKKIHEFMGKYGILPESVVAQAAHLYQLENDPDSTTPLRVHEPIERWFLYDGDDAGLKEFIDATEFEWFVKGGKDKKNYPLVFLKKDELSVAAIRCTSNKHYQNLLYKLREYE